MRREGAGHDTKSAGMKPHDSGAASGNATPRSNGNARARDADKGSRPTSQQACWSSQQVCSASLCPRPMFRLGRYSASD